MKYRDTKSLRSTTVRPVRRNLGAVRETGNAARSAPPERPLRSPGAAGTPGYRAGPRRSAYAQPSVCRVDRDPEDPTAWHIRRRVPVRADHRRAGRNAVAPGPAVAAF